MAKNKVPRKLTLVAGDKAFDAWASITSINQVMRRLRDSELRQYALNSREASILLVIAQLGDRAYPAQLARQLHLRPNALTYMLNVMEARGLVEKHHDLERKNKVRAILTERGVAALKSSCRRDSIHDVMSCLSGSELKQLQDIMDKIRERLQATGAMARTLPFTTANVLE